MVHVKVVKVLVFCEVCVVMSCGFSIVLKDANEVQLSEEQNFDDSARNIHFPTVHHYARHGLCRAFEGQRYFYQALKTKLRNVRLSFIANFVMDLCRTRTYLLDSWVAELFDVDEKRKKEQGDGLISHFEKHLYREDD